MSKFNFSPDDIKGVDITVLDYETPKYDVMSKEQFSAMVECTSTCPICEDRNVPKALNMRSLKQGE